MSELKSFEPEIYVIFSRSQKPFAIGGWFIAEAEKRPYSHTAILYKCPISGELMIFQASLGMVNCFNYEIFKEKNKVIKKYRLDCSPEKFIEFYSFKQKRLGRAYSKVQLLWIALNKLFQVKSWPSELYSLVTNGEKSFICSEIAAISCMILNIDLSTALKNKELDFITPSDLDKILEDAGLKWQECDL